MHEYLKILVVENKLIDYQYFMDIMRPYEIFDLLELVPWANKHSYEQMRIIMWATLKPYLKNNRMTPERLLPFYTDTHRSEVITPELNEKQIEDLRKHILDKYNAPKKDGK